MPWIENISYIDALNGNHYNPGPGGILIQLYDPCTQPPKPGWCGWGEIHQFCFLDVNTGPGAITTMQAKQIADILRHAKEADVNVVVHCHAGICRSGAVVEAAVTALGFADTGQWRQPNVLVKRLLLAELAPGADYQEM